MNISFMSKDFDHYRQQKSLLEMQYKEAIRLDKEFSEVKKIYEALKKTQGKFQSAAQKNHHTKHA